MKKETFLKICRYSHIHVLKKPPWSPQEEAVYNHLRDPGAKERFLKRHAAFGMWVHDLGIRGAELVYTFEGQPFLRKESTVYAVSLSSFEDVCAFALSKNTQIGIDIQKNINIKWTPHFLDLTLSKNEKDLFLSLSCEERKAFFFKVWTQKEAYVKALGKGLWLDLKIIDVKTLGAHMILKTYQTKNYTLSFCSLDWGKFYDENSGA